jgi:uncharacterized protein with HEPN domain
MNRDQQRLNDYLAHILEAIDRINQYTQGMDETAFMANRLVQDAVIRNFEIIGEASYNIDKHYPQFAAAHPKLPLAPAYQMRNAVATGISKSIWESSGKRFTATCLDCASKSGQPLKI